MNIATNKMVINNETLNTVEGRNLQAALSNNTDHTTWMRRALDAAYLTENVDYVTVHKTVEANTRGGARSYDEYHLTLEAAKSIAMMQRSELGKKVRDYFIQLEKEYKQMYIDSYQIEDPMERAQAWMAEQQRVMQLAEENRQKQSLLDEQAPTIQAYDNLIDNTDSMSITEAARTLGVQPRKWLMPKLLEKKWLTSNRQASSNAVKHGVMENKLVDTGYNTSSQARLTAEGVSYIAKNWIKENTL